VGPERLLLASWAVPVDRQRGQAGSPSAPLQAAEVEVGPPLRPTEGRTEGPVQPQAMLGPEPTEAPEPRRGAAEAPPPLLAQGAAEAAEVPQAVLEAMGPQVLPGS
jgi:hypothetical protein